MTFDYQPSGLGRATKNAHPECGVMVVAVFAIVFVTLALIFR
jgi:hypothetical protein